MTTAFCFAGCSPDGVKKMSNYTHTEKAGKKGDVVKHLLLIESLDFVTSEFFPSE